MNTVNPHYSKLTRRWPLTIKQRLKKRQSLSLAMSWSVVVFSPILLLELHPGHASLSAMTVCEQKKKRCHSIQLVNGCECKYLSLQLPLLDWGWGNVALSPQTHSLELYRDSMTVRSWHEEGCPVNCWLWLLDLLSSFLSPESVILPYYVLMNVEQSI